MYNQVGESDSDSESDSDDENVQLRDDTDHSSEFYLAGDNGMTPNGNEYLRVLPS